MVKKVSKSSNAAAQMAGMQLSNSVRESAQQIWQAGLGAFARAQAEGSKAFEALVKEGVHLQRKTQTAAEDKINEATSRMTTMASDISNKASGQWDKLEGIFEDRVARALNKLGVPSAKDINALIARIDELNAAVQRLSAKPAAPKPAASAATKKARPAAKKAVKTAPAKKTTAAKKAAPSATAE